MKDVFKDFLFTKHILVRTPGEVTPEEAFTVVVALAKKFSIRITNGAKLADKELLEDAARCLGEYVPEPFYRGFPDSVRELTSEQLLFDQLYHYTQTYGMGWFNEAGHSVVEQVYERIGFNEHTEPRDFEILMETEAKERLKGYLTALLSGNRPLNVDQLAVIMEGYETFGQDILPEKIPCKDTAVRLMNEFHELVFCRYLVLSDMIKVLNYIQVHDYHSENLKKLNLKNKDRRFLTKALDWFFESEIATKEWKHYIDTDICHEKRKIWCGLLHHIHYRGRNVAAQAFVNGIRGGKNQSVMSRFEKHMRLCQYAEAAKVLKAHKGESALIRNLNYILSRCDEREMEEVLKWLE